MSLRLKTVMGVALIEAFLLALLIGTVVSYQHDSAEQALLKRAATTASLFASTAKDPVLSLDLASLEAFSDELLANPDLVYVRVLDASGQVYSEAGNAGHFKDSFREDLTLEEAVDGVFDTSANIVEGGIIYGHVEIGFNTDSINEVIAETRKLSISIAAVEMILVGLFSFLLGTYLTGQLKVLRQSAKKISGGDYTVQIPVKSNDEVADVAKAFNKMSTALLDSQVSRDNFEAQLVELNQTLEDRVERRTAKINSQMIELKAAGEKIADTQAQLIQSEKLASVGQLAAGVAHEINNPIGFVRSNLSSLSAYVGVYQSLLKKYQRLETVADEQREEQRQEINEIETSEDIEYINEDIVALVKESIDGTTRVRDIVQGLSDFSNMGGQEKTSCPINECVASSLELLSAQHKASCNIVQELQSGSSVLASRNELSEVLFNLIENACQATGENGDIRISTADEESEVKVTVSDSGPGIEDDHLDRLFDPFFTTKPVGEGTGLGLAISYGIIKDHGGEIEVESEKGVGTTFVVSIPLEHVEVERKAA